jgi:hypothetical protein
MAFYSALGAPGMGGGNFGGMGGNQSAFTNPGVDPMALALLLRMQNANVPGANTGMGGMGNMAPQIPQAAPQQGGMNPAMMGALRGAGGAQMPQGATASPQQGGLMQGLGGVNPQQLQQLMQILGLGGGGGVGGGGGTTMFQPAPLSPMPMMPGGR